MVILIFLFCIDLKLKMCYLAYSLIACSQIRMVQSTCYFLLSNVYINGSASFGAKSAKLRTLPKKFDNLT